MVRLNHSVKASTLVESLIAMVILAVCLGIGTMVYTNVLGSDKERKQLHASLLADSEAIKIKSEQNYLNGEDKIEGWTLKRTIERYDQTENLFVLSITILDLENKVITVRRELIIVE